MQYFIEDKHIKWQDMSSGIKRKIMSHDNSMMIVKVAFEKDAAGTLHHHYHTQISYVETGVFEIEIDGKKQILSKGDVFHVPPDIWHGVVCKEAGVLIDIFNPAREDFLN